MQDNLDNILARRAVPQVGAHLAERIIAQAQPRIRTKTSFFQELMAFFQEDIMIPRPALAFSFMLMIGVIGALSGFALGYLLSVALGSIEIKNPFLDSNRLPLAYSYLHYSAAGLVAIVSSIAAGYLPARKAARVHPVDIIRGAT